MDKNASEVGKSLSFILPLVLASTLSSYYVPKGLRKIEESGRRRKVGDKWLKVLAKYPQLADDPKSKDNFEALAMLYPTLADNPEAIISALRIAQDYSTEGIDPNTLKTLADAERGVNDAYGTPAGKDSFNLARELMTINKDMPAPDPSSITWGLI